MKKQSIDVGAFIWPAYSGKEKRNHIFWPDGEGEWQTVRLAQPKFEGHTWPRKPLLGYQDEADPKVMEQQIELALSHGVNVFIYDWYWYDERAFQEQCLNDGFLGASNSKDMKFYLMWANHDANHLWDRRLSSSPDDAGTVIWKGAVDADTFREIGLRWIEKYFVLDNYYRIDGKPVLAIYELPNFVNGVGGIDQAIELMNWLDAEAAARGLGGVHFQLIHRGDKRKVTNLSGVAGDGSISNDELLEKMPFSSATHYQYCHFTNIDRAYPDIMVDVNAEWKRLNESISKLYCPHVSLGWDNNARYSTEFRPRMMRETTPENIEQAFADAKELALKNNAPLVTVNSWNEWTEGSYLLPDDLNGYAYLEAIKHVFIDE